MLARMLVKTNEEGKPRSSLRSSGGTVMTVATNDCESFADATYFGVDTFQDLNLSGRSLLKGANDSSSSIVVDNPSAQVITQVAKEKVEDWSDMEQTNGVPVLRRSSGHNNSSRQDRKKKKIIVLRASDFTFCGEPNADGHPTPMDSKDIQNVIKRWQKSEGAGESFRKQPQRRSSDMSLPGDKGKRSTSVRRRLHSSMSDGLDFMVEELARVEKEALSSRAGEDPIGNPPQTPARRSRSKVRKTETPRSEAGEGISPTRSLSPAKSPRTPEDRRSRSKVRKSETPRSEAGEGNSPTRSRSMSPTKSPRTPEDRLSRSKVRKSETPRSEAGEDISPTRSLSPAKSPHTPEDRRSRSKVRRTETPRSDDGEGISPTRSLSPAKSPHSPNDRRSRSKVRKTETPRSGAKTGATPGRSSSSNRRSCQVSDEDVANLQGSFASLGDGTCATNYRRSLSTNPRRRVGAAEENRRRSISRGRRQRRSGSPTTPKRSPKEKKEEEPSKGTSKLDAILLRHALKKQQGSDSSTTHSGSPRRRSRASLLLREAEEKQALGKNEEGQEEEAKISFPNDLESVNISPRKLSLSNAFGLNITVGRKDPEEVNRVAPNRSASYQTPRNEEPKRGAHRTRSTDLTSLSGASIPEDLVEQMRAAGYRIKRVPQ